MKVIIATKLKKKLGEISDSKSIRDFVAGKSTLQNELLGDIQKEFGQTGPDNGAELPLNELAKAFEGYFSF